MDKGKVILVAMLMFVSGVAVTEFAVILTGGRRRDIVTIRSEPVAKVEVAKVEVPKIIEKKIERKPKPQKGKTYIVKNGDSLSRIAQIVYGNGRKWVAIYNANKDKLKSPHSVRVGMMLDIPVSANVVTPHKEWAPRGYEFWKSVPVKLTAYTPGSRSCWPYDDGKTSIGDNAWIMNGVAVCPTVIPYRTWLKIPGIGWKEADDTGGRMRQSARRGIYHLDVRVESNSQAYSSKVNRWTKVDLWRKSRKVAQL